MTTLNLKELAISCGAAQQGARLSFMTHNLQEYTSHVKALLAAAIREDLEKFPKEDLTWRRAMEAAAKVVEAALVQSPYKFYEPLFWQDYTPGVTPLPMPTQKIHYILRGGVRMTHNGGVLASAVLWDERGDDTIESFCVVGK